MSDAGHPLPPFAALRAFHAAAGAGRLKDAAKTLGITESAVSHQIRNLEDFVGVALFERQGRQLGLTPAGERYFAALDPAMLQIREATAVLMGPADRVRVTLTLPPSLAILWMIPNLGAFEAACPGIDLQLVTTARLCDMRREQIDLAIRHGHGVWSGLESRFLAAERAFPVCRPGYLDEALLADPGAALAQSRLIVNSVHPDEWTEWAKVHGLKPPSTAGALSLTALEHVLEAAESGLGLAIGRRPAVDARLQAGNLIAPFGTAETTGAGYYLCWPADAQPTAAARRVMRLLESLAEDKEGGI
jgi:LysR family glycine cleavage system transcriptional activator